jgi:DNA processing protein
VEDPPPYFFALGDIGLLTTPIVSIVGTRASTAYGDRMARELAAAIARAGGCVASGLARGIDAAAHRGALEANGKTIAVLGTGLDIVYPPAHRALQAAIGRTGLLLSEQHPGDRAHGGSFPARNRIIAAIARTTLVVEAPFGSGALITARYAIQCGRDVAVVPGPIDSANFSGSNDLMQSGAHVITCAADLVSLAELQSPARKPSDMDPGEQLVWAQLAAGPVDMDTLSTRTRLPARECMAAVTGLELSGAIECGLDGLIRRR